MSKIEIEINEAKQIFYLLEKLNDFFHQPKNHENSEQIKAFATSIYPNISEAYYKIVWEWLPQEVQKEIEKS